MEKRIFGRTGMRLSILGFGCGAVGGLMVRGDPADQERTVARALEAGVNYFDTAVQYGDGASETNLGRVLKALKPANAFVGTKVRLKPEEFGHIGAALPASARPPSGGRHGRRRHPCARGRRALRLAGAPPDCEPAARADRLGEELRRRPRARPPLHAARYGELREPHRIGDALLAL